MGADEGQPDPDVMPEDLRPPQTTRVPGWRVVMWMVAALVAGAVIWGGLEDLMERCEPSAFYFLEMWCDVLNATPVVAGVLAFVAVAVGGFVRERAVRRAARLRDQWRDREDRSGDT